MRSRRERSSLTFLCDQAVAMPAPRPRSRTPFAPAVVLALAVGLSSSTPARAGPQDLRERLIERARAGDADSARALIRSNRGAVRPALEALFAERAGHLHAGQADSAASVAGFGNAIATLYAAEFADSFCMRMAAYEQEASLRMPASWGAGWARLLDARRLYMAGRWPQVREALPELARLAEESGDPYLRQSVHHLAANCFGEQGAFEEAREEYAKALALARQLDDRLSESRLLANIAGTFQEQERLDEAISTLRAVLDVGRRMQDRELEAYAYDAIATNLKQRGDLDSARVWFEEGIVRARAAGALKYEAIMLTSLGQVLGQLGEYEAAIEREEEALRKARLLESLSRKPELNALLHLGWLHRESEQYSRALLALGEALPIAEEAGVAQEAASIRAQMGEMCRLLGRPEDALEHFRVTLPALRRLGLVSQELDILHLMGLTLIDQGRLDEALQTAQDALATAGRTKNRLALARSLSDVGHAYGLRGDLREAERHLLGARAIAESIGYANLLARLDVALGELRARQGNDAEALLLFDRAAARGRATGATAVVRESLRDAGEIFRRRGDLDAADSLFSEAIATLESVREQERGEDVRVGFFAGRKDIYTARVAVLVEKAKRAESGNVAVEEAFATAERARARALLDVLSAERADPGDAVPGPVREKARRLAEHLATAQERLSRAVSSEKWDEGLVDSLEEEVERMARGYRSALAEASTYSPAYGALRGVRPTLSADEVRRRVLAPDQVLLEYLVGPEETFVFLIGRDRFRCARLPLAEDSLATLVARWRDRILGDSAAVAGLAERAATPDARASDEMSRLLHRALIEPIAADLPEQARLLIVPDGPLFYLPFAALHDGTRFLVERHAIAFAPSASVLDPAIRTAARPRAPSLLAVGNPASFRAQALLASVRGAAGWRFGELPHAEEEVRRVRGHFEHARALVGYDATEEAVKAAAGRASHLHFATHALLHEEEPLLSGLVLAQDDDPAEDGILQTHEILRMSLPAELVVLSACNTGLGRIAGGEGVLGLTRAFLHAGARALVMSLWEVGDRSTAELMDAFYRAHLDEGLPTDEALRAAQTASLAAGRPAREWAPFALIGYAAPPSRGGRAAARHLVIACASGLGLFALAVLAVRSERRRGR